MKKIARPFLILLPALLMTVSTFSEARSFSSRGFGSSKMFKRPVQQKPTPTATPAPTAQQNAAASGKQGIPGAEQYRSLSQQAPSQRLKNAINTRGNSGVRLTQLAMLYWLLSSSNTHASELTDDDRAWVNKEIKEKEKNGEKLEESAPPAANAPAKP
ncbi:hypothetical protein SAMN05216522_105148 [Rosenbergiella nectarea]|uniref:Uncharacterized protein n=1 Tax=Rosenbergiella nectarea TaxID=988801 RepID=A0A1H9I0D3_9GAMM|nr:hypothetical protein [Rosenbergiella nectarea]SEQ68007.1 hypothetical protein SAMN05216522_105148 [Rosenbergiella nectarea]